MGKNCRVTKNLKDTILQNMDGNEYDGRLLPGDNYPDWLTFSCENSSITFEVPHVEGRNLKTMMCIVSSLTSNQIESNGLKNMLVINHTKNTIQLFKRETLTKWKWQRLVSNIEPGNKVEVVVVFENGFSVKKTTIYLIYADPYEKIGELSCTK